MRDWLMRPVDAASLGLFRILFGLCMAYSFGTYLLKGAVERDLIHPRFHFPYPGLEVPLPAGWLAWAVVGWIVLSSLLIAVGFYTRVSAALFAVFHTWWFLSDAAYYNNHYYLVSLLGLLFCVTSSNRWLSWDRPSRWWIPAWQLYLFRFQIALVYWFGAVAKLNPDWLRGIPVCFWLTDRSQSFPVLAHPAATWIVSYGGILVDFGAPILLLFRRTRWIGLAVLVVFHLSNDSLFSIGIFPWLMLSACVLFLEPDSPRRWLRLTALQRPEKPVPEPLKPAMEFFLVVYCAAQLLLPWRHLLIPGDAAWTEEGHLFSWRMKLREKAGLIGFAVVDGQRGYLPDTYRDLTPFQVRKMLGRPWMIREYAEFLSREARLQGYTSPRVLAWTWVSLNRRPHQTLVDPLQDAASPLETWIQPFRDLRYPPPGPCTLDLSILQPKPREHVSFHVDILDEPTNVPVSTGRMEARETAQATRFTGLPAGRHRILVLVTSPGGLVMGHLVSAIELQPGPNQAVARLENFQRGPPVGLRTGGSAPVEPLSNDGQQ
ncbi:MAG: HTTM domain-containing protein [Candidatus Eremiobacterota bacterium]